MASYQAALDYLYYQLPMYQRQGPKAFKKDLKNIQVLCEQLNNPQSKLTCIHIAGTNGKGSTSHYIAAMLQAAGYRVGMYTSPHYKDFRERIKIDGAFIPKKRVVEFVDWIKENVTIQPSFFEITVAMAFHFFHEEAVDIAVIETGLGGRLDSTNVVHPILSVITNISLDHTNFLGNTLPAIAGEKAGIIKHNTPVLIGRHQTECAEVFESKATQNNATLTWAEEVFHIRESANCTNIESKNDRWKYAIDKKQFTPEYTVENMRTALAAIDMLHQENLLSIPKTARQRGLDHVHDLTYFIGRWMMLGQDPLVIADSAHNKDGLTLAMHALQNYNYRQLHVVLGFVFDKDIGPALQLFPKDATYYFAKADIPRGLDATKLKEAASEYGLRGKAYTSIRRALAAAKRRANPGDLIYVGGSIFTVAEVI